MKRIRVAVGVILQGDCVLVAQRQPGQHLAGYWEFPGGKIEPEETLASALRRELSEELGLKPHLPDDLAPWQVVEHDYPDKQVRLEFVRVSLPEQSGYGREGQRIAWTHVNRLSGLNMPEANKAVIRALLIDNARVN